jgi:tetratricopeptide (TPR) repeat protein
VLAVAPTRSAVEELDKAGFTGAVTVSRLLSDAEMQNSLRNKVLIVDEAGMISGRQMQELLHIANDHHARIVFSGDTRQVQSVEAGDTTHRIAEGTSATRTEMAELRKFVEASFDRAVQAGRVPEQELAAKDAEISRLAEELRKLQRQLAARASEPAEAELSTLLATGDLDAALRLKTEQVERRRTDVSKLPRDLFELGRIHEFHFDWQKALLAYREAWELERDPEYGFNYAYSAQKQNCFSAAAGAYEQVRDIYRTLAADNPDAYLPHLAATLNNLAALYDETQRMEEAEEAFGEALSIRRNLATTNPNRHLADVAVTLNNLANLYINTQRLNKAGEAFGEALSIYRNLATINPDTYLPDVAVTLNNLASLYSNTLRLKEAEEAYGKALSICQGLAACSPGAYLPYVAMTLTNLANLYSDTQRMKKAEEAYSGALSIRRKLAETNPSAYLPDLALTLNNLANFYSDTQRKKEAEEAYGEALSTYRDLAVTNRESYLPHVAMTLNNIANLYGATQRMKEAEEAHAEALSTYRELGAIPTSLASP